MDLGFLKPSGSRTQKISAFAERRCSRRAKIHKIDGVARGNEGSAHIEEAIRNKAIAFEVGGEVAKVNIFKIGTEAVAHTTFHQESVVPVMRKHGAFDEVAFANGFFASSRVGVVGIGGGDDPFASTPPALVALGKFLIVTTPKQISEMLPIVPNYVNIEPEGTSVHLLREQVM